MESRSKCGLTSTARLQHAFIQKLAVPQRLKLQLDQHTPEPLRRHSLRPSCENEKIDPNMPITWDKVTLALEDETLPESDAQSTLFRIEHAAFIAPSEVCVRGLSIYICAYVYVCMCMCICMCMCMSLCVYICMYVCVCYHN